MALRSGATAGLSSSAPRSAFTLVEILVTIGIFLLLTAMTLAMVNISGNRDRVRGAARHLQSRLEGARDRAIYAGEPRGVRFLLETNGLKNTSGQAITTVSSVYIGAPGRQSGTIQVTGTRTIADVVGGDELATWQRLQQRGILPASPGLAYISIQTVGTTFSRYTLVDTDPDPMVGAWEITKDYGGTPDTPVEYRLELLPSVLPNQEPVLFPRNVVIDLSASIDALSNSHLPRSWGTPADADWPKQSLDIMFSPLGTVTGPDASGGLMHLVLRDLIDVANIVDWQHSDATNGPEGDQLVVTVTPSTGSISSHPVFLVPTVATPDPFLFAETGEVAK